MATISPTGRGWLAPYACQAAESRGRLFDEPSSPTRTPFQRDRDRIIHSTAFRRLKHKTQVFVFHEGDHFRTRLTHSIEVSQIARSLARAFEVDEDLAEALALSHDFGHTPFGHTGEEALAELMWDYGGFDHNAQSLRIVTQLERRYARFDGLNLCWETLEGLVKHNGPLLGPFSDGRPVDETIIDFNKRFDLELDRFAGIEAQCAAIADDIAYNAHDLDDGLRAGLFSLEDIRDLSLTGVHYREIMDSFPGLEESRAIHEIVRRQITSMVEDAIKAGMGKIAALSPDSAEAVRGASETLITFSPEMALQVQAIKKFLFGHMYRAPSIMRIRDGASKVVTDLFRAYMENPEKMSEEWRKSFLRADGEAAATARVVADFLAGMTDQYAILEHQRLFDDTPELR